MSRKMLCKILHTLALDAAYRLVSFVLSELPKVLEYSGKSIVAANADTQRSRLDQAEVCALALHDLGKGQAIQDSFFSPLPIDYPSKVELVASMGATSSHGSQKMSQSIAVNRRDSRCPNFAKMSQRVAGVGCPIGLGMRPR